MVYRQNIVFLTHKAGINLHEITDEAVEKKGMAMVTTALVFLGAMMFCLLSGCGLKKREDRLSLEATLSKRQIASIAFQQDNRSDDDDSYKAAH